MYLYPFLLLPGEIKRLQQAVSHLLTVKPRTHAGLVDILRILLPKCEQALACTGYSRKETMHLTGLSRQTLNKKLGAYSELEGLPRNGLISRQIVHQLAMPQLTMCLRTRAIPPDGPARLLELNVAEVVVIGQALADYRLIQADPLTLYLADYFAWLEDARAVLPVRAVIDHWALKLNTRSVARRDWFATITRRGPFYRIKIAGGVLRLVEADARTRHFDTCHFYRREILIFGRNTWVIKQSEPESDSPISLANLLPNGSDEQTIP